MLWETRPDKLAEKIASLRSPVMLGANVTIPYKEDVVPLVDECDPVAARIEAINTIVNRDGRLFGYNTDAPGFISALIGCKAYPFDCSGKRVLILGTGGAARAAAVGLLEKGAGIQHAQRNEHEHGDRVKGDGRGCEEGIPGVAKAVRGRQRSGHLG